MNILIPTSKRDLTPLQFYYKDGFGIQKEKMLISH